MSEFDREEALTYLAEAVDAVDQCGAVATLASNDELSDQCENLVAELMALYDTL